MPVFTIFEFAFILGFLTCFFHFHAATRQKMMLMKFVASLLGAFYFWGIGAETGMMACFIAGLGGLSQAAFADHILERTKMLRAGIAIVLAAAGIAVAAGNSVEALPLVATIISRFSEVQSCRQRIRMGYVMSQVVWITYALSSGLIILYVTENINMLSNLKAIWSHEQGRKKLVPIMVKAA